MSLLVLAVLVVGCVRFTLAARQRLVEKNKALEAENAKLRAEKEELELLRKRIDIWVCGLDDLLRSISRAENNGG